MKNCTDYYLLTGLTGLATFYSITSGNRSNAFVNGYKQNELCWSSPRFDYFAWQTATLSVCNRTLSFLNQPPP